ncbi:M13 family metallopeptidase [Prevotella sp.]|uniref:M13 family metallopeptidase n=1 Tax=Prevotella sp. TaxID=59823 RepID=UPI00264A3E8A|nr:M13 family metallopeptidase [Prevotella sp.]MDN5553335.1 M13 family metallopeptidase [Prevotella sp.]
MKSKLILAAMLICSTAASAQGLKSGIDKSNMDLSVKPGDNFYEYSVGNWLKTHPLDAQHPMNGSFVDLEEQNNDRIRELVEGYANTPQKQGTLGQKIGSLYRMYMDTARLDREGITPIKPILKRIAEIKNRKEYAKAMADLSAIGYNTTMYGFGLGTDAKNSDKYLVSIGQGGIGLDPEYYTKPNEQQKAVVAAYKSLIKDLLKMVGNNDAVAEKKMQAIFAIQNQIAKVSYDQIKSRDPQANYHKMSWGKLLKDYPGIDWNYLAKSSFFPAIDSVDVGQPEPIHEVEKILAKTPLEDLKAYMEYNVVSSASGTLSKKFFDRKFEFNKTLYGVKEEQPRWKYALSFVQNLLGEAVGKLYVKKYFPESSKQLAIELVKNLQNALAERIQENTWMTDVTKKQAIEKLRAFRIRIGYPDKWQNNDSAVVVDESKSLRENLENLNVVLQKYEVKKRFGKPVDKDEWFCTPQTVNAYYSPESNSINFPAAILQAPFFDPEADAAANFGGIGSVIGHEMSHGFDDQGCQFDKNGNLNNWWTAEDKTNYDKRTKVLADWFSTQEVLPGLKVNGEKTLGENIGDNGGINVAFRAFQNAIKKNPLENKDGFTPEQRFFLAYGRIWASNIAPQFVAYIVNSDTHSPNIARVNGALPMIDAWYDTFDVKPGDKLYVPIEKRAHIW